MPRIAITTSSFAVDELPDAYRDADIVRNPHGRTLTEDEVAALLADVDGVIAGVEPLTAAVFASAPRLKAIARVGAGLDTVDLDAAAARGIAVSTTPDAPTDAVAELTLALMLAVLRDVAGSDRRLRAGTWQRTTGRLLSACTVGLIGGGRIGARVAELVGAFGAEVLVADPQLTAAPAPARLVDLDTLLATSDIVSLHVPLTDATRELIDAEAIRTMRDDAILINAARGGLVDEAALAAALATGTLAGAGIDVFATEPYDGPLTRLDNVVLSPHAGSAARETRQRMEREAAEQLAAALHQAGVW